MKKKNLLFMSFMLACIGFGFAEDVIVETISTPGSSSWVCPPGVTEITVECWGGGGAGGAVGASQGTLPSRRRAGGGSGAGYATKKITVVPGISYNYTIGAGGIAQLANEVTQDTRIDGNPTFFIDEQTVYAVKGVGGQSKGSGSDIDLGLGGTALKSGGVGDVVYYGGNGSDGVQNDGGGGGGGSAGNSSDGNDANGINGGIAVAGGGEGALGRTNNFGLPGGIPGAGGSGAGNGKDSDIPRSGGNGGNGMIKISYVGTAIEYTWSGGSSASWTDGENWIPERETPAVTDVLKIEDEGAVLITDLPATETLGKLLISEGTLLTLEATTNNSVLTIHGENGLMVPENASLDLKGSTKSIKINLGVDATGIIEGEIKVYGTDNDTGVNHQITAAATGSVLFKSGSKFTAGTNFTGFPFGNTPNGAFVFKYGSTYIHQSGNSPFGGSLAVNVSTFEAGSVYKHISKTGNPGGEKAAIYKPILGGKTYADFVMDTPTQTFNESLGNAYSIDNIDLKGSTYTIQHNNTTADIKGNVNLRADGGVILSTDAVWSFSGTSGTQTVTTYDNGIFNQAVDEVTAKYEIKNDVVFDANVDVYGITDIQSGKTLTVAAGRTLDFKENSNCTNNGSILNKGTVVLDGSYAGSGYIQTLNSGVVKADVNGSKLFPVATSTVYAPISFVDNNVDDNIAVSVRGTFSKTLKDAQKAVQLEWSIGNDDAGENTGTMTLQWSESSENIDFNRNEDVKVIIVHEDNTSESYSVSVTGDDPYAAVMTTPSTLSYTDYVMVGNAAAFDFITSLTKTEETASILVNGNQVMIKGYEGSSISIFNLSGTTVLQRSFINNLETVDVPSRGVYLIKIERNNAVPVIVKLLVNVN